VSRRELWLSVALVGSVALVVRVVAAALVPFPIPEDTAYYYGVARNLVEGRGLVSDAVWSFQTPPLVVPRQAFEVWMPLPTLLAAIPMAVFGPDYRVAQILPVVVGSLIPILTWRLAWETARDRGFSATRARVLAIGAGLTAAVELPLLLHSTLPDSTALFALFVLIGCLLMPRLLERPRAATWREAWRDPRLWGLGAAIGFAALTRNEAVWLAFTWFVLVAWWLRGRRRIGRRPDRSETASFDEVLRRRTNRDDWVAALRLLVVPAVVALVIFAPWAIRNQLTLGTALPSQTVTNAFSVTGFDIFAFQDPPTLSRYLAVGPARLLDMRIEGFEHNLLTVLLLPSFPIGLIGLFTLPWFGGGRRLRPLLFVSLITFAFTTLVFPVATTWGTYLHAAGAAHVLLIISCLFGLDALIARVGRLRGWTKPVAWLGPALTIFAAVAFSLVLFPGFGAQSRDVQTRYQALPVQLAAAGVPPVAQMGPVISDFPIWWAEGERAPALGLPDESPTSILALARAFPGTHYLVMSTTDHGRWPAVLSQGVPDANCFREVNLGAPTDERAKAALKDTHVYELVCP
jgi:hypothetical protein